MTAKHLPCIICKSEIFILLITVRSVWTGWTAAVTWFIHVGQQFIWRFCFICLTFNSWRFTNTTVQSSDCTSSFPDESLYSVSEDSLSPKWSPIFTCLLYNHHRVCDTAAYICVISCITHGIPRCYSQLLHLAAWHRNRGLEASGLSNGDGCSGNVMYILLPTIVTSGLFHFAQRCSTRTSTFFTFVPFLPNYVSTLPFWGETCCFRPFGVVCVVVHSNLVDTVSP